MTQAEKLCANVSADLKPQAMTLAKAIVALQEKIEQQIPIYDQMPLAQTVKVGTGEKMLRQNPAMAEFRATVREYAQTLQSFNAITGKKEPEKKTEMLTVVGNSKWKKRA